MSKNRFGMCAAAGALMSAAAATAAHADTTLTIATVNNVQMIEMQKLSPQFEKQHPDIHLRWVTLEENTLRQRVTTDIATHGGQFDILTIGNYEVPIWAKQKWLVSFDDMPASYDMGDIIDTVRQGISSQGHVYALPFYAESAMTLYRKDLFAKAGLSMPDAPTYDQIRQYADKLTDKANGTTLVTAMGGQWFTRNWHAAIDSDAWKKAITFYDGILKADGPPGAATNGFNENLALFASGHCAMWVDATSAAGTLYDPKQSKVASEVGFAAIPTGSFTGGPTWLWSWNLAIPSSSKNVDAAKTFIAWATSKEYINLVAQTDGWVNIPPGTRTSSYGNAEYKKVAPFADFVLAAIEHSNPNGQTAQPRPYVGAQFADIPEFQGIGTQVGQTVAATLVGSTSVNAGLSSANRAADRTMRQAGYFQ